MVSGGGEFEDGCGGDWGFFSIVAVTVTLLTGAFAETLLASGFFGSSFGFCSVLVSSWFLRFC